MLSYLLATLTIAGVYALLALGLNVIWGMAAIIASSCQRVMMEPQKLERSSGRMVIAAMLLE